MLLQHGDPICESQRTSKRYWLLAVLLSSQCDVANAGSFLFGQAQSTHPAFLEN